ANRFFLISVVVAFLTPAAHAQYFGRNKVQWESFKFKTLQTEHFDIYYYDQESDVENDVGRMAERWYTRLSHVFNHTFNRKPIVLYANSADFQQTTTTGGLIGEGTGGFTDEFMNRVVLPLTGDYAENDHVLGHELVHVFQYDIAAGQVNQRRRFNLDQLPLWLVEGMAEYFSKGRIDPLTAMWIRDATIHNRLPDLKKLTRDPRYFPYRYGEALLAYIGGRFGDDAVIRYFMAAGMTGIEPAFERVIGLNAKQVFTDWQESARELYNPVVQSRPSNLGTPILSKKSTRGDLNVGPSISPDGRYVAFLSSRDLFDIDLYLADAHTGQILRKLVSSDRDAHFDALRFIDSSGGWSPDSRRLAFVVFEKGDNFLGIVDADAHKIDHVRIPGVDALTNPVWSPDGHTIAFSGQTTGVTDLFLYDLDSKSVRRLTNDKYADLQPAFSPDGRTIAFASDRGAGTNLDALHFTEMQIATIDVNSGSIKVLPLFAEAKHINPQWSPDGNSIYFVANPEGIPDIYRYALADGQVTQITNVQTGVSGITEMSPSLSVAARTGEIAFSLYENDDYNIYTLPASPAGTAVASLGPGETPRAAILPPFRATGSEITAYLQRPEQGLLPSNTRFRERSYSSGLHVAYIGPPTLGAEADQYGFGVGGSVAAYWTDILGQHNLGFTLQGAGYSSNGAGSFADQIGGEVFYLNQQKRFNWGGDLTHIPYVAIGQSFQTGRDSNGQPVGIYQQLTQIQTIDDFSAVAQYPFNTTRRFEMQGGYQRFGFKETVETLVVDVNGNIIDDTRQRLPGGFAINLVKGSAAFVGDSSIFGFVSPVRGTRYRYEVESLTGDLRFQTALADWRKYYFVRPVTVAVRGLHYGRYGTDSEDPRLTPLYLGQGELVRGYDPYSININECVDPNGTGACPALDRLVGSRIAAASVEARVPLLGTKEYGLINAPAVPTELFAFADGGAAWSKGDKVKLKYQTNTTEHVPVFSVGVGMRILLSYIPLEFYAAKPFQRPTESVVYGFNIIPGW
ncbi:MAG: BamA/TamA family outer membrane protein, partial [Thermoanaerobaculia bacterium]